MFSGCSQEKKPSVPDKEGITETIIAMEKAALEAWNKGNPSGYLQIYAPDITYFDPFQEKRIDGFDKMNAFYEDLRGQISVDAYEMIDPVVQVGDDMAVLTYNLIAHSGDTVYKWNCTEVYQRATDQQWEIIHNHWSFIRPMDME